MKLSLTSLTSKQFNLIQQFCEEENLDFPLDDTEIYFSSSEATELIEFLITNKQSILARQIEDILFSNQEFDKYDWS